MEQNSFTIKINQLNIWYTVASLSFLIIKLFNSWSIYQSELLRRCRLLLVVEKNAGLEHHFIDFLIFGSDII